MQILHQTNSSEKRPDNKGLGFVAVYFNVAGYTALRSNFERFIERFSWMGDRLLIVELAYFSRDFEMTGKHSNMLQLRSDSVMWHKENLMNVGTMELRKQGFKHVGWLDGDVIIDHDPEEWFDKCEESLLENNLVQVAEKVVPMFADYKREQYLSCAEYFLTNANHWDCYAAGLGWVMPGKLWDKCHYYDMAILGTGDCLNFVGALTDAVDFNEFAGFKKSGALNELPFYLAWVQRWRNQIQGKVSFVSDVSSTAEEHGDRNGRQYSDRISGLLEIGYNPYDDVARDENGVLMWTEKASDELKQFCLMYFVNRKEDD